MSSVPREMPAGRGMVPRLISGGIWGLAARVLTAALNLAFSLVLTRLLAPGDVGAFFLCFSLVNIAAIVANLGLRNAVVRAVAENMSVGEQRTARSAVLKSLLLGGLGAALVAGAIYAGVGRLIGGRLFNNPAMAAASGLVALWVALHSMQCLSGEIFRGFRDIRMATLLGPVAPKGLALGLLAVLWFAVGRSDLRTALRLTVAAGCAGLILTLFPLVASLSSMTGGARRDFRWSALIGMGGPLLASGLGLFVLNNAALWVVGAMRPASDAAVFGAAVRLAGIPGLFLLAANAVLPPTIAHLNAQDRREEMETVLRGYASVTTALALAVCLPLLVFAEPVLSVVFGPAYRPGAPVLRLLGLAGLINVFVGSCGYTLAMTGHHRALMYISLLSGGVAVLAGIALTGALGLPGAGLAAMTALLLQRILVLLEARRKCGVWTHASPRLFVDGIRRLRARYWGTVQ